MAQTTTTIPTNGDMPSISDGTRRAPAIMQYEFWSTSQLSLVKYFGQIKINGHVYKLLDSGEPCAPGLCKTDLVRDDWCSLYKKYGRSLKEYIIKGMTPAQVRKLLKGKKQ